jgi:hypothetical protein
MAQGQELALAEPTSITKTGFGTTEAIVQHETAATAVAARVTAEIQARTIVALQRPRNPDLVRQKILSECKRPSFARAARYSVPMGKDRIEGLSIRFAEAAQRCMGNLDTSSCIIYDDTRKTILHITSTDLESNTTYSSEVVVPKTVERRYLKQGQQPLGQRVNSYGEMVYLVEATDGDMAKTTGAVKSKEIRTLILRHLPGDIKDEAESLCIKVAADEDAKDPDAARREMFDAFFAVGVPADQLAQYLGHEGKILSPAELAELRAVFAAVREGHVSWIEALEHKLGGGEPKDDAAAKAKDQKVQSALDKAKAKQAAAKKPAGSPAPDTTGAAADAYSNGQ